MNLGDLNKVWEIKALKKADQEKAKMMLEKIAKQVQPIMRKHNWRVKVLSEFCPKNPSLLGLNVGAGIHIKLRLRRPNRDLDFFPFHQVLDTMLHELCHNAHGPHNSNFYKLWDELRKECEELMAKGVTGTAEGFDLPGRRLGGLSRQPPLSSLRKTTLAAAEKRARLGSLLPSGPKRLGGDSAIMGALSPVQAAAMAAERRLQDDIWCGSQSCELSGDEDIDSNPVEDLDHKGGKAGNSRETVHSTPPPDPISRKRSRESDSSLSIPSDFKYVDLTTDTVEIGSISEHQKRISCSRSNTEAGSSAAHSSIPYSKPLPVENGTLHYEKPSMWECLMCTLLNRPLAPICELCGTQRPKDVAARYDSWSCKFCTLENSVKLDKCSACDQWRYSHGAPVSTRAPNLGT
ncbi:DNA-dependent metalloprotease WSS1 isoform X1 [Senna tora]|uniref:DNA-dependent metalloprotease WSS1 isoform X1 n=1 Tax=Senna tora TaxID=362788 RepID=A0A834U4L5_9FABA|nr:DNA-dependent metalloprotease WSS1 isoform X1 [Senna tora]